ncbi:MAG: glycine C-acetyltransferase [Proteobacteria bacterium]|nr:glycine C-acetyltransferase [Pseudomonadota bacterium]
MRERFYTRVADTLEQIRNDGLEKPERIMQAAQGAETQVGEAGNPRRVINFCANNYLGLAGDPRVVAAGNKAAETWGAGLASVRFICGTQAIHKQLEAEIAGYLGKEDAILFAAAFDANGGVFEPLLGENDAIVSDSLNHASLIDGIRLCKARRYRYANGDMAELEAMLKQARAEGAETVLIATDGVFSMDGHIAPLDRVCALADQYDALVLVDDCHATGLIGPGGRGSAAFRGCEARIDIVTGTFGKALGGAMGGFVAARAEVVALLRQRARPYLFSNALAPSVCGASLEAIAIARSAEGEQRREQLRANAARFRNGMAAAGFTLIPGEHPIVPVMLGDARLAQDMAAALLDDGVFVTGFSYPVVPLGKARIRTQLSAAHTAEQIDEAVAAFTRVGRKLGVIA